MWPFTRRTERRDSGGLGLDFGWWGGSPDAGWWGGSAGSDRNPASAVLAENLAGVQACVNVVSSTAAALPARVVRVTDTGPIEQPTHPVSRLIRQGPNARQAWGEWVEMQVAQLLLHGNSLNVIGTDARGAVTSLTPIPWQAVRPLLLHSSDRDDQPRLVFDVVASWGWFLAMPGISKRYLDTEVLLLRDRTDDSFLGRSRISRSRGVIENAIGLQEYSSSFWRRGTSLSGVLRTPGRLTDGARERMKLDWKDMYSGVHNARKTAILEEGLEWTALSVSPEDAQVLASRQFSILEIARIFGVPPILVGDWERAQFSNSSAASSFFGQYTILPIVTKIEQAFAKSVFTDPSVQLDLDLSGLMRGSYSERWTANVAAVTAGILSPNEVRSSEGWGAHPDGALLRTMPGAALPEGNPSISPPVRPKLNGAATGAAAGMEP